MVSRPSRIEKLRMRIYESLNRECSSQGKATVLTAVEPCHLGRNRTWPHVTSVHSAKPVEARPETVTSALVARYLRKSCRLIRFPYSVAAGMQSSLLALALANRFFPDPLVALPCAISVSGCQTWRSSATVIFLEEKLPVFSAQLSGLSKEAQNVSKVFESDRFGGLLANVASL